MNKSGRPVVKFYYNERGQRIKKESYNTVSPYALTNTDYYILDLSGNVMAIYNQPNGSGTIVQKDLPIFELSRLGVYNRTAGTSTYEITDHLGNVRAVVQKNTSTGTTDIKSYADYYPFGEQLPMRNSLSNYRYAFQGQELDGETGMEAFQLRLWDGRLGRWLSPDPMGQYSSPYLGMGNSPVNRIDPDGGFDIEPNHKAYEGETHFDSSDNTYYVGKADGSWTESSMLAGITVQNSYTNSFFDNFTSSFINNDFYSGTDLKLKDPFPNTKWAWFENNFSGHPVWGTGGGTMELGQKSGRNGQRYNPIYADQMVLPGGGGARAQNIFLVINRDIAWGYGRGETLGAFDDKHSFKYVRYEKTINSYNLNDSTITEESMSLHLRGLPSIVNKQIDSLNNLYAKQQSIKNGYLNSWGR